MLEVDVITITHSNPINNFLSVLLGKGVREVEGVWHE